MTLTRDSLLLWVGMLGSIIVGLASLGNVSDYGIPDAWLPYLRLAALIVGIVSGKLATSPLPGANDANKIKGR
jgi:small basic protein